jgi:hypothetical protein
VKPFLGALSIYCPKLKNLELKLNEPFGTNEELLRMWNDIYDDPDEDTEPPFHYKRVWPAGLDCLKGRRCQYLSDPEEQRKVSMFPPKCRITVRTKVKRDEYLPEIFTCISKFCKDIQSLTIDRSKSDPKHGLKDKGECATVDPRLRHPAKVSN